MSKLTDRIAELKAGKALKPPAEQVQNVEVNTSSGGFPWSKMLFIGTGAAMIVVGAFVYLWDSRIAADRQSFADYLRDLEDFLKDANLAGDEGSADNEDSLTFIPGLKLVLEGTGFALASTANNAALVYGELLNLVENSFTTTMSGSDYGDSLTRPALLAKGIRGSRNTKNAFCFRVPGHAKGYINLNTFYRYAGYDKFGAIEDAIATGWCGCTRKEYWDNFTAYFSGFGAEIQSIGSGYSPRFIAIITEESEYVVGQTSEYLPVRSIYRLMGFKKDLKMNADEVAYIPGTFVAHPLIQNFSMGLATSALKYPDKAGYYGPLPNMILINIMLDRSPFKLGNVVTSYTSKSNRNALLAHGYYAEMLKHGSITGGDLEEGLFGIKKFSKARIAIWGYAKSVENSERRIPNLFVPDDANDNYIVYNKAHAWDYSVKFRDTYKGIASSYLINGDKLSDAGNQIELQLNTFLNNVISDLNGILLGDPMTASILAASFPSIRHIVDAAAKFLIKALMSEYDAASFYMSPVVIYPDYNKLDDQPVDEVKGNAVEADGEAQYDKNNGEELSLKNAVDITSTFNFKVD